MKVAKRSAGNKSAGKFVDFIGLLAFFGFIGSIGSVGSIELLASVKCAPVEYAMHSTG